VCVCWPVPQTSSYNAPPAAPTGRLPLVPWTALAHLRNLGKGAFGDVALMDWSARGLTVAVKCNGTDCVDGAAIDNERRLYELLLTNPHDHILPVYGICTDAPDGKVQLVMKYSAKGSLDKYLTGTAKPEVGGSVEGGWWCVVTSTWSFPPQQPVSSRPLSLSLLLTQGGLRLSSVLSILVQAVAGLLHLHSLGILHRDLRAANLLLDGLDPLHARVADFGVSHLLSAFAAGLRATDLTAGKVPTVLRGSAALGPMQVCGCATILCA
jgi:serine/threonine protein kinase